MKKIILLIFILTTAYSQAQVIGEYLKTVPQGKWWRLQQTDKVIIEFRDIVFIDGSYCHAIVEQNHTISTITEGQRFTSLSYKCYSIHFKTIDKAIGTNENTYIISGLTFDCMDMKTKVITHPISIYLETGQNVWAADCIESIQFTEYQAVTGE